MTAPTASGGTELVFLDTETTSLRANRRAWEIAAIHRVPEVADVEYRWFIQAADLDLASADPYSLAIGRYWQRHPQPQRQLPSIEADTEGCYSEVAALLALEKLIRGAHVVGAVPNFDDHVLSTRMAAHGIAATWHYHLIDVEAMMIGFLAGRGDHPGLPAPLQEVITPPWHSDQLSLAIGVEPPSEAERHTALGDARWVRAIYDTITRPAWAGAQR